jgi:hypothetical protein
MAKLNHADAIIFDLRDNPGGYANMVALVATYLFDRPTHLNDFYDRSKNSTEESWTLPPVPGNRLADKPAFVLTSSTTFSAAEGFSYDLKMLKRATLATSPELDQTAAAQLLTTTAPTTFAEDMTLDAAARHRVIDGASGRV